MTEKTYWNNNGRYAKKNKILWDKYIPLSGVNLTNNDIVNRAIIQFRKRSKQYYRYYNDGDRVPGITHSPSALERSWKYNQQQKDEITKKDELKLERWMDRTILRLWKISKGGKIPVTRYRNN